MEKGCKDNKPFAAIPFEVFCDVYEIYNTLDFITVSKSFERKGYTVFDYPNYGNNGHCVVIMKTTLHL